MGVGALAVYLSVVWHRRLILSIIDLASRTFIWAAKRRT